MSKSLSLLTPYKYTLSQKWSYSPRKKNLVAEPNIFVIQNPDIYRCIRSKIDKLGFFYAEISDLFWDSVCRIGTEAHLKCDSSAI